MKKFKIKCIQHLLKNNEIAKFGEIVNENKIISLKSSINGGFIEEVKSSLEDNSDDDSEAKKAKKEAKKAKKEAKKAKKAKKAKEAKEAKEETLDKKLSKFKKADLIKFAEENNYIIDANETMPLIIKDILDQDKESNNIDETKTDNEDLAPKNGASSEEE